MTKFRRECAKCKTMRPEAAYISARGRVCLVCRNETKRKAHRKQRVAEYGLTPSEYDALVERQSGVCAICHQSRKYLLNVDHDHKREREEGSRASVRGLLCRNCNRLLRIARDNATTLQAAADYLNWPPAWAVLDPDPTSDIG